MGTKPTAQKDEAGKPIDATPTLVRFPRITLRLPPHALSPYVPNHPIDSITARLTLRKPPYPPREFMRRTSKEYACMMPLSTHP